jgi:peptidoglycan/LPS O-acetylase OafA/YrhL
MSDNRKFVTLDGLRGIAALVVVTRHAPGFFGSPAPFPESFLAVDFFFVLSGFVLTHAYEQKLRSGMTPLRFMMIRIIRLFPLYLMALVICFWIAISQESIGMAVIALQFILGLFFLPGPPGAGTFSGLIPLNLPTWSLHFELLANFFYAIGARYLTQGRLIVLVVVGGLCLILAGSNRWLGFGGPGEPMSAGFTASAYWAGLARVMFSFFCGVLVYRLWKGAEAKIAFPPLLAGIVLAAILLSYPSENYQIAFELAAIIVAFPIIVFLAAGSTPRGPMAWLFAAMGRVSYAIYVIQVPVYLFIYGAALTLSGGRHTLRLADGLLFIAILVLSALWADSRYDTPVRRILTRRFIGAGGSTEFRHPVKL